MSTLILTYLAPATILLLMSFAGLLDYRFDRKDRFKDFLENLKLSIFWPYKIFTDTGFSRLITLIFG